MKTLALAFAAVAVSTGAALSADLPARSYTKAPVLAEPVANWTGFYLFGGGGYGLWEADTFTSNPVTGLCALCVVQKQGGTGYFGTAGAGYDWQFNSSWVAGLFGDGQFGSIKGTIQNNGFAVGNEKLQDTWAVGVRVGYLVTPSVLTYVNGGWTGSHWSGTTLVASFDGTILNAHTNAFDEKNGWFIGGGVENKLNILGINAPGWFMKTEYRVAQFKNTKISELSDLTGLPAYNDVYFKPVVQTISASLVYRFNWGGPPVASY